MKRETVKRIKKIAREKIPVSSLRGKVIPSKRRKLIEETREKEKFEKEKWLIPKSGGKGCR